jgi:hypothetical protein
MKSFRRMDGNDEPPALGRNGERNFHREKCSNETHASTTDPDGRLARKSNGEGAKLAFTGHPLMENPTGLVVDACLTHATGTAEPEAALERPKREGTCRACICTCMACILLRHAAAHVIVAIKLREPSMADESQPHLGSPMVPS